MAEVTATFAALASLAALWILCVIYLRAPFWGFVATKVLNAFVMSDGTHVRVGSLHLSPLTATLTFENVVYATTNSVTKIGETEPHRVHGRVPTHTGP